MTPRQRLDLILLVLGAAALLLPWLAWARLRWLERRSGARLLVRGVNGDQAARIVLLRGELPELPVDETLDFLGDSYAAHLPAVRLAHRTYFGRTLFAVARAARAAAHALQHRDRDGGAGRLARLDGLGVLWGNAWPVVLALVLLSPGRMGGLRDFAAFALAMAAMQVLAHLTVAAAARRGRSALDEARLLDGHPPDEVDDAFAAARMEHLAAPARQSLWGALRRREG
jgi:Zn-dependent membrane protease YugP